MDNKLPKGGTLSLPKGWVETAFTDIYDIKGGTQPPKSQFIECPKDGYIRLLQIRDFGKKPVPTFVPNTSKLRTCSIDDVVIARYGASIGRIMTGKQGAYNVAIAKVDIPDSIDKTFVLWLLKSNLFQNKITSFQRTAQSGFNKNDLSNIFLPLPPLAEQKRIVKKLDIIFGNLDNLKSRLENIPALLKNFRQAVLTQAVTGKLTEEWRVGKDVGEWKNVELGTLISLIESGKSFSCPGHPVTKDSVGLVKISAVTWGVFDPKETKTVIDSERIIPKFFINKGDFLISRANTIELVGSSVIVREIEYDIMLSDKVWRVLFHDNITKEYSNLFLKSRVGRTEIEDKSSGNQESMRNISQKNFKSINVPYPSLNEQTEIVQRVESLFVKADAIETQYKTLKQKIDNLPQAILAKAFKGELVKQLDTDGSAEDLLKDILELKGELGGNKKTKKKIK